MYISIRAHFPASVVILYVATLHLSDARDSYEFSAMDILLVNKPYEFLCNIGAPNLLLDMILANSASNLQEALIFARRKQKLYIAS